MGGSPEPRVKRPYPYLPVEEVSIELIATTNRAAEAFWKARLDGVPEVGLLATYRYLRRDSDPRSSLSKPRAS